MVKSPTLLSIQVGLPAEHDADLISDKTWQSGIFKFPLEGRVLVGEINLSGDGQDDRVNHGGPFRVVLAYSADHYPIWQTELGREAIPYGSFGENFTVAGLDEQTVCLGDIYAVGEIILQVSQPRHPCWKLARRMGIKDLAARVEKRGWGGWYHRVLQTGYVQAGDAYQFIDRPHPQFPISRINALLMKREDNPAACGELSELEAFSPQWRTLFANRAQL